VEIWLAFVADGFMPLDYNLITASKLHHERDAMAGMIRMDEESDVEDAQRR
jgi:hypothetical protein